MDAIGWYTRATKRLWKKPTCGSPVLVMSQAAHCHVSKQLGIKKWQNVTGLSFWIIFAVRCKIVEWNLTVTWKIIAQLMQSEICGDGVTDLLQTCWHLSCCLIWMCLSRFLNRSTHQSIAQTAAMISATNLHVRDIVHSILQYCKTTNRFFRYAVLSFV